MVETMLGELTFMCRFIDSSQQSRESDAIIPVPQGRKARFRGIRSLAGRWWGRDGAQVFAELHPTAFLGPLLVFTDQQAWLKNSVQQGHAQEAFGT